MWSCIYFGLFVLFVIFLVPQGAKWCRTSTIRRTYNYTLFAVYLGGVIWLTLINRWGRGTASFRFDPFHVVRQLLDCWFGFHKISAATCRAVFKNSAHLFDSVHVTPIEDLLLNIILFMPLGFLLPYLWPQLNLWKTILCTFCISASIEITQYFARVGCCDIDDVINNVLGACIGYGCWKIHQKFIAH